MHLISLGTSPNISPVGAFNYAIDEWERNLHTMPDNLKVTVSLKNQIGYYIQVKEGKIKTIVYV